MRNNNFTFQILIKGKTIQEYSHEGKLYVEGRDGSEFEIEFRNDTNRSVMMIPSVDGLCVLDGKPAGSHSKGYIVKPWRTLTVPGWLLDNNNAAKFQFESKKSGHYVNQVTGSSANAGVIGCIVFAEDVPEKQYVPYPVPQPYPVPYPYYPVNPAPMPIRPRPWTNPIWCSTSTAKFTAGASASSGREYLSGSIDVLHAASDGTPQWASMPMNCSGSLGSLGSISCSATGATGPQGPSGTTGPVGSSNIPDPPRGANGPAGPMNASVGVEGQPELMGTAFGERTDFRTTTETFNRGKELSRMVIYYKARRDLERMGIQIVNSTYHRASTDPNPFPGEGGCKPPPGWNG